MKKLLYLGLWVFLVSLSIVLAYYLFQKHQKYACRQDQECVLSTTDVEDCLLCVHTGYYQTAKKVWYQCLIPKEVYCACQDQRCVLKSSE